jgi:myo-inositol-1(or 4)-monophosphatase
MNLPSSLPPLFDLLESVREITRRAGEIAVGKLAQVEGEIKEDKTYVTAIDRQLEQFLRRELEGLAPEVGFLGEEYGRSGNQDCLWIIDPIDGTNNLVYGIPQWGISVGLAVEGESVLGVFHMPLTRETFYAVSGGGAYVNGERLQPSAEHVAHQQHCLGVTTEVVREYNLTPVSGYFRLLGTIAGEIVYAARGSLYACISRGDKVVDLGAAVCIAKEAGCTLEYLSRRPFLLQEWIDGNIPDEPLLIGPEWAVRELQDILKLKAPGD